MLPKVYTPEEVAEALKVSTEEVIQVLEDKQIDVIKLGSIVRIPERSLDLLLKSEDGSSRSRPTPEIDIKIQPTSAFSYHWPNGLVTYEQAYDGEVSINERRFYLQVGIRNRESFGRNRGRIVIFLDKYPVAEFVETDVDDSYVSLLPGSENPRSNLRPDQDIPREFRDFKTAIMVDLMDGPGVYKAQVAVIERTDINSMVKFAALKGRYKGRV